LENPTFDDVIDRCKQLGLYETMGFRYGWNREILVNSIALTIMILIKHYYLDHSRREVLHWLHDFLLLAWSWHEGWRMHSYP
jgi:hypothetical protein